MPSDDDKAPAFNMIWRNLDRSFSMPVFSKHEAALIQVARELSYTSSVVDGSGRARAFVIHVARLAERRGLCRETLSRGVADLLKDGVFLGTRESLRINKHYRKWTGKHALTQVQINECDDALLVPVTVCGSVVGSGHSGAPGTPENTKEISDVVTKKSQESVGEVVTKKSHCDAKLVTKKSQICDEIVTDPVGATIGTRGIEFNSEIRVAVEDAVRACDPPDGRLNHTDVPVQARRPFKPDPADVARVIEWATAATDPLDDVPAQVSRFSVSYPLDWIEAAVLCGIVGARPGRVWGYAHKCLLSWWAKGVPDHAEVAAARSPGVNGVRASPPSKFMIDHEAADRAMEIAKAEDSKHGR